jgi:hypothetical protein
MRADKVIAVTSAAVIACLCMAQDQQNQYSKPPQLPNPYRLVEGWPSAAKAGQ